MNKNPQMRKVLMTINNPSDCRLDLNMVDDLVVHEIKPQYYCRSMEVGEKGTPHFHPAIFCPSPIRFSTLKRLFPTAHIERAYGSMAENREGGNVPDLQRCVEPNFDTF